MQNTRRDFLAVCGGLAAAASVDACRAEEPTLPIVDTHQHLWDLDKFHLPWLDSATELKRSFLPADYAKATKGLNVVKAVYMEVDVHPSQQVAEAEYIIDQCQRDDTPTVAAVISGRPNSPGFRDYIQRFAGSPYIKGVRQVLHTAETPRGYCLEPEFVRSIQLLGELGMSFDLGMRPNELADGLKLVEQCPGTRFVVDHCGNGDPAAFLPEKLRSGQKPLHDAEEWKRTIGRLAEKPNAICKISGIVARTRKGAWKPEDLAPAINHCLDSFGPDRVVFGGDWPVCLLAATFAQWVDALMEIIRDRPADHQKKLLHDNAVRHYGLT